MTRSTSLATPIAAAIRGTMITSPVIKVSVIAAQVGAIPWRSKRSRNGHVAIARTEAHASPGTKCRNIQSVANATAATNRKRPISCRDEVVPGSITLRSISHHVDDQADGQRSDADEIVDNGILNLADMNDIEHCGFQSPKWDAWHERKASDHCEIDKQKISNEPNGCEPMQCRGAHCLLLSSRATAFT